MSNPASSLPARQEHEGKQTPHTAIADAQWHKDQNAEQYGAASVALQADGSSHLAAQFTADTTTPTPPPATISNTLLIPNLDTSSHLHLSPETPNRRSPSPASAGLRIQTDAIPGYHVTAASAINTARSSGDFSQLPPPSEPIAMPAPAQGLARTPSIKNVLSNSLGNETASASASALSSPNLNAIVNVTPLPSPLMSSDSPGPWKKLIKRPTSRDLTIPMAASSALVTASGESIASAIANQTKRKGYSGLGLANSITEAKLGSVINSEKKAEGHSKSRSISDYTPDNIQFPKIRNITVSGSHAIVTDVAPDSAASDVSMRREPNLAVQRGLADIPRPPTPPLSRTDSDSDSSVKALKTRHASDFEYFDARTRGDSKKRRWRALRQLGQGTFSRVMLATTQAPEEDPSDDDDVFEDRMVGVLSPNAARRIDRKKLVAIKVCMQGAQGGADEARIEMSTKRELEFMKTLHHPSLIHLKAWNVEIERLILVLSYCPGGDLFEVASMHRQVLSAGLVRRMFSELVGAVRYLHSAHIVHRDLKLENVLVNLPHQELAVDQDWTTYPYSVITLTDLGLSRRVTDEELLTTRCGSDDYAAPEVILGQPYDGRATDAWSLGVLLYALCEARLPFDAHPAMTEAQRKRSRTSHRIARIEWAWIDYCGEEGDHESDPRKFEERGLYGALKCTEGLLQRIRSRWSMDQLAEYEWVRDAINVPGGVQFREEENAEEVLDIDTSPV